MASLRDLADDPLDEGRDGARGWRLVWRDARSIAEPFEAADLQPDAVQLFRDALALGTQPLLEGDPSAINEPRCLPAPLSDD
jgi:hypothetical protein